MKKYKMTLILTVCAIAMHVPSMAQSVKKLTPVVEMGAGLSIENKSGYGETVYGLATMISVGLDIRVDEKWSIMPSVGHNTMFGDAIQLFSGAIGSDFDVFDFFNAAILGRLHSDGGITIGFGPVAFLRAHHSTYYIDWDPDDPRNGLEKIKPWDLGLRATFDKELSRHWTLGAQFNAGLRNMMIQYPSAGISGTMHLFSLTFTAGYRF